MSFFNWNEERHKRRFEEQDGKPEPEPTFPRLDVPEVEKGRWDFGEYSGETLTYLSVNKIPGVPAEKLREAVFSPGRQVAGDLIVTVDGYRWLRLTEPSDYFGKYVATEDWDKRHTYIQIESSLSIPQSLYRIRKDDPPRITLPDWDNNMTWAAPAVHPMYISTNPAHSTIRTRLSPWEKYLRTLNDTKRKWNYYTNDHAGLFNATGWDKQESLVMGNNIVVVDRIGAHRKVGQMAKLRTMFIQDPRPDPELLNYQTCPWLIHKFTVITRNGSVVDPNPGSVYYPVILNMGGEGWIQMAKLEKFPQLPLTVDVEVAVGLNVRLKPSLNGEKVSAIPKGAPIEITAYRPAGSEVWARCEGGWIALYHPQTTPNYLTSWRMENEPPPP